MLILGMSGAVTALGDTLVLTGGISPAEHALVATLVELRVLHPIVAIVTGALVAWSAWLAMQWRPDELSRRLGRLLIGIYIGQLLVGSLNVALRAPVWLQLVHLTITSVIWLLFVLLAAHALQCSQTERSPAAPKAALGKLA